MSCWLSLASISSALAPPARFRFVSFCDYHCVLSPLHALRGLNKTFLTRNIYARTVHALAVIFFPASTLTYTSHTVRTGITSLLQNCSAVARWYHTVYVSNFFQPFPIVFHYFSYLLAHVCLGLYTYFRYTAHLYFTSYDRLESLLVYSSSHRHQGAGNEPQGGLGSKVIVLLRVVSRPHPCGWITGRVLERRRGPILIACVAVIRT